MLPPVPASLPRFLVLALALSLPAGCSDDATGYVPPQPGSTPPGQPCAQTADCGCWECTCQGVSGAPGGAQFCNKSCPPGQDCKGICPTGQDACATVCKYLGAPVDMATPAPSCPARP